MRENRISVPRVGRDQNKRLQMPGDSTDGFSTGLELRAYLTGSRVEGELWGKVGSQSLGTGAGRPAG